MRKPRAMFASSRPMRPMPRMPRRLPSKVTPRSCVGAQPSHLPARTMRSPSPARRAAISRRVKAVSAVAKESTSGVLVTAMPRALAAWRSTWSKPTLKVVMIFTLSGRALMQPASRASPAAPNMPSALASAARRAICAPSVAHMLVVRVEPRVVVAGGARLDGLGQLAGHEQDGLGHRGRSPRFPRLRQDASGGSVGGRHTSPAAPCQPGRRGAGSRPKRGSAGQWISVCAGAAPW